MKDCLEQINIILENMENFSLILPEFDNREEILNNIKKCEDQLKCIGYEIVNSKGF